MFIYDTNASKLLLTNGQLLFGRESGIQLKAR